MRKRSKNEIKKNNSEIINIIILNFSIDKIYKECIPCKVLSRTVSRNHIKEDEIRMDIFNIINIKLLEYIQKIVLNNKCNKSNEGIIGQGLKVTT
jgi:hypothetical protein